MAGRPKVAQVNTGFNLFVVGWFVGGFCCLFFKNRARYAGVC